MKAWMVTDKDYICESAEIVYAEKASKAKAIAQNGEILQGDFPYKDLRAHRMKKLDHTYKGQRFAEWDDPEVKMILVKEYQWACLDPEREDCLKCEAREYCPAYEPQYTIFADGFAEYEFDNKEKMLAKLEELKKEEEGYRYKRHWYWEET